MKLSAATWDKVRKLFAPAEQQAVGDLLINSCGTNLPFCENSDERALERIRFAVLKLSDGDLSQLQRWVDEAQVDWRDVLMAAGFGHSLSAHTQWRI